MCRYKCDHGLKVIGMSDNRFHKPSFQESEKTDQSAQDEIEYVAVGQLRRPHGVRGEILMSVWTEFPERLQSGVQVFLGEAHQPVHIRSVRSHGDGLLLAFDEYFSREEVGLFRNTLVMVRTDDRPLLEEGELYIHQLLGLAVVEDDSGRPLGTLVEVLETGANDVYIVKDQHGVDLLLPAIESVIVAIDLPNRQIRVHLLPGLLEG